MRSASEVQNAPGTAGTGLEPAPGAQRAGDEARVRGVEAWSRTEGERPPECCIHQLFQAQARRTPAAVALVHEHEDVSYAALNGRANRLARHLARLGVGPEVRVGVCLERGVELVVALLAVLKAGGAYVPLDPAYPPERLAFMLADSGAAVLLARERLRPLAGTPGALRVVCVDADAAEIGRERDDDPESGAGPGSLAYLIYTSGSTGVPKGVAIEHASTVALLAWAWSVFTADELSGVLAATSVCFDLSVFELFLPLSRGGTVVVVENALALPASAAAGRVRLVNTVPSAIAALLDSGGIPPTVRTVNLAGEPLSAQLVDGLYAHGVERVHDLYGPSEDTTYSTWTLRRPGGPVTIGRPIANTQAYVLDEGMRRVDGGEDGELLLGGRGLARGYLGRPALTAERFVPDPFGAAPGGRLYRTGDRARLRADGTLEYRGRLDHQVKIRGFRVELGEVEAVLRRHPGVRDCVVVVREDAPGQPRLVAYVVGGAGAGTLRAHLEQALPAYMVPAAFVPLDALPLTPNGKTDRKALPAPEPGGDERHVEPRTPTERTLAEIWRALLGVDRVSADRPFLELGAHSLLGIRVLSRIRDAFGVQVPPHALLRSGTIQEIAALVDTAAGPAPGGAAPAPALVRVPRAGPVPLSFSQAATWFFEQFSPGQMAYRAQATIRMRGPLDVAALERALTEIVRRHEIFRTTFVVQDGDPVQRIHAPWPVRLPLRDVSGMAAGERDAAARAFVRGQFLEPFDVAVLPLAWWSLVRMGPDDHVLVVVEHHFVHDGWSFGVLLRELRTLYLAYTEGVEPSLPEPALQFADFAVWQRRWMESEAAQAGLRYWEAELAGVPPLELATDFPRPARMRFRGARERVHLPPALVARARAFSRAHGATFFTTLMTAFQALMGRYSGQRDFCVGSGLANRGQLALEDVIGMVVNTVGVRADLSGDPTGRELLGRVRDTLLRAAGHQDVPFDQVVRRLQPERSATMLPIFQVCFHAHDSPMADLSFGALRLELDDVQDNGSAKFDLQVTVVPRAEQGIAGREEEVVLVWEYDTDLFRPGTVQGITRHYETLLEHLVRGPERRLSTLELVDAPERRRVVEEWNATAAEYPRRGIPQLFAEQAARTPDATAVVFGDASLTYAELDARANRLARRLVRLGVGLEARVGICLERSADLVIAILAVLKAGGAYVPLDPGYPAERLALMLADSAVQVLLTQDALRAALPAQADVPVVRVDGERDEIERESAAPVDGGAGPGSLAYVMYTSGSTGIPRGVAVEHRGVVRLVRGADYVEFGPGETILQAAPVSFDASTLELWGALLNGGRLVLVPGANPSLEELGRTLVRHGVTTLWLTAGLFQVMVQERLEDLAGVRQLLAGGDVLPVEAVRRLKERFPECRLINGYGPTENTTFTCCYTVPDGWSGGAIPIGTPISNTRVYVLDGAMRPVPAGVPGELYAGGDGVARGYLDRPAATAERFVPDPFSADAGARLYRTGDRVRWTADGTVEYLGRLDAQVKVRGFRIELGEIETALRRHAGVADCAVIPREDVPGDRRLVAYVVGDADGEELRAHLRRTLPDYMAPAAFVPLESIPLTLNGKLDRRALPAPEYAADEAFVAPRTPVEEVLAGIWADVLHLDRVGATDDFFALGGHSLVATRMVSRVRHVFGVELPLRALFERPTVAALTASVEEARRAGLPLPPPVVPVQRGGPLPLSFAQERLWFLDRMEPGDASYNVTRVLRLDGALDAAALERALGEIVRRHEALRTTFREMGDVPVQAIAPFGGFHLPVHDLAPLGEAEREAEVMRRADAEAAQPFDLEAGPLFRPALLRLGGESHVLLLAMHHVVSDEWSLGVLFRELAALYGAYREGRPSPLPEPAVQYADFALWQRAQLRGAALDRQLAYWRARLAGAPALLELPADRPRPAVRSRRGARAFFALPAALRERLEALGRGEGATPYMVLLAAFQVLLSRYAGTDDVVVGSPVAGRTRGETEALIGFFVNTLVLRTDLSGDPGFREVLRRVREVALGAYQHQDVPFETLVAELQPERSRSRSPLFQVTFALEGAGRDAPVLPGVDVRMLDPRRDTSKYDLLMTLAPGGQGLQGELTYSTDLFEPGTIQRLAVHFQRVLEQVAEDADRPLSALELTDEAERRTVLEAWNGTDAEVPAHACIHHLFEAQAERTPDAVALVFEDTSLTYRELNERANRLAHALRRRGVSPEVRVGLCLERSLEMVVAILAVLKAGGGYVPLEPGYPAERLAYMLADSGVAVVLTQNRVRSALPTSAGTDVVSLDDAADEIASENAANPASGVLPGSLAYVIYTSGSTGRPKGVMNQHGAVVNRLAWMQAEYGLAADDVVLQKTPFSFDVSVWEFFWPLQQGATLVVARPDGHRDPAYLQDVIERHGVTTLHFVPSMLQPFVEVAGAGRCARLKRVICSGEALSPALVDAFHARFPAPTAIHNLYGPTEAAVDVSHWACGRGESAGITPIGRPVWNTRLYVLDEWMRPAPVGIPGELYIGGVQVARGYLDRPGLTAERFVPNPFASTAGVRLYRTGDRARWRADGALEYLGRLDHQVKIRGFRIEPGEIEGALRRQPGVAECAVVAREDAPGDRRLVAYVVGAADADDLRAHLRRTLPDYMVPAAFVPLDALPLTSSGKLDRRALPAPEQAPAGDAYVAPRTQVEEVLAGIWAEVLQRERVGVTDDFFAIGGHSLLAARVIARIRTTLGGGVGVVALFDHPTVGGLARLLAGQPAPDAMETRMAGPAPSPHSLLASMHELPDAELDRLLALAAEDGGME